jgi:hypothetical protein
MFLFQSLFLRLKYKRQDDFKEQTEKLVRFFFLYTPRTGEEKIKPGNILYPVSNPRFKVPIMALFLLDPKHEDTTILSNATICQSTRSRILFIIIEIVTIEILLLVLVPMIKPRQRGRAYYMLRRRNIYKIFGPDLLKAGTWYFDIYGRIILNCILGANNFKF